MVQNIIGPYNKSMMMNIFWSYESSVWTFRHEQLEPYLRGETLVHRAIRARPTDGGQRYSRLAYVGITVASERDYDKHERTTPVYAMLPV